ncbi:Por secretion system C-terminal sorting domain-containing protein [Algoriphagus locisalis]|uniref:Por secretion system C-terminal sorting domain-containing protein n=1 Tax=Algoriphagus locisalis TaxID=305507 RepID=A0A1I6XX19_9BACT|nr:Por secretion system C-terminal sorting domain-containing protein [Algoriphagus locisalis]
MARANYRIVDMAGRVLQQGLTPAQQEILELDVTDIQAGIYIFEAFDTKRVLVGRFIKN